MRAVRWAARKQVSSALTRRTAHQWNGSRRMLSAKANESFWAREIKVYAALAAATVAGVAAYKSLYHDKIPIQVTVMMQQAAEAEKAGDYRTAIVMYTKALRVVQASPFGEVSQFVVLFALAHCYDEAGMIDLAEEYYNEAAKFSSSGHEAMVMGGGARVRHSRAITYERLGQISQDRKDFGKALEYYLRGVEALVENPSILEACWERWSKAKTKTNPLSEWIPVEEMENHKPLLSSRVAKDVAGILNNLGMLYLEMGRPQEARSVFGRCLAVAEAFIPISEQTGPIRECLDTVSQLYFDELSEATSSQTTDSQA